MNWNPVGDGIYEVPDPANADRILARVIRWTDSRVSWRTVAPPDRGTASSLEAAKSAAERRLSTEGAAA